MTLPNDIIPDNDQTRARREHLERIGALVGNVYPNGFTRTSVTATPEGEDTVSSIVREFRHHEPRTEEGARPTPEQLDAANAELNKHTVRISGRLATPPRVMGKAAFVHLSDGSERLQVYVRKSDVRAVSNDTGEVFEDTGAGWELFGLLDHGDFVGVAGTLFVTRTGELSVQVSELQFLAKALLPMPDKLHGVSDPEIRQRQRYVDLIAGSLKVEKDEKDGETAEGGEQPAPPSRELSTREVFVRRSRMITEMRRYLDDHGYIEVETPMLSPIASGAAARPFKTHHNALDIDLYARIAPELYLKRLLVGGFERVYELNRNFRNEGIGYRWNPEFTMLEFYCAYMDANGMMDFSEELLRTSIRSATGGMTTRWGEHDIDFGRAFKRLSMKQAIVSYWPQEYAVLGGENFDATWLDELKRLRAITRFFAHRLVEGDTFTKERVDERWTIFNEAASDAPGPDGESEEAEIARLVAATFEYVAESKIVQPTFIHDFPKAISPLSKASPANPAIAERFELYAAGMELANGFSELNDPVEQYERFLDQGRQRERGDEEAMRMDEDYVRALAYGMPPAAGIGIGVDRIAMLLTNRRSIRDVILFPHMRPRVSVEEPAADDNNQQSDK